MFVSGDNIYFVFLNISINSYHVLSSSNFPFKSLFVLSSISVRFASPYRDIFIIIIVYPILLVHFSISCLYINEILLNNNQWRKNR